MTLKSSPELVQNAFAKLKRNTGKKLSLHRISDGYYVYEYRYIRDEIGITTIRTTYVGHITKIGNFVAKGEKRKEQITGVEQCDEREVIALRNLSMNGRMSMAKLAKRIGMSVTGTRHFIKRLEKKYNIRYFAEVDTLKLGYFRYIALIKFEDKAPRIEEIRKAFTNDPQVGFVGMIQGSYDMMIIFYVKNNVLMTNFIYNWRSTNALPEYTAKWYITPLGMASCVTIPLRKEFVEKILSNEINVDKDEVISTGLLTGVEKLVLKELVINGSQDFREIDKKYGLNIGRSNYAFYKLKEKEILERSTITINPLGLKYNAIFITQTNNYKKFVEHRDKSLVDLINSKDKIIDEYAFRGDIGIPDSIFHIRPIFDEKRFYEAKEKLDTIAGTETEGMIITEIIIGSLCYRNFDPVYTQTYEKLLKNNKVRVQNRLEY